MFRRPTPENFANYQLQSGIGRQPKSGKIPIKRRKKTKLKKTRVAPPLQLRAQDIDKRRAVYRPDRLLQLHQSSLNNATRTAQEVQRGLTATGTTLGNERQLLEAKASSLIESRAKTELFKQLGTALKENKPILGYSNHRAPDDLNSTSQRRAQGFKQESDSETRENIYKALLGGAPVRPPSDLGYREQRQPLEDPVPELGYRAQRQPEDLNRLDSVSKFIPVEEPLLRTISQATESSEGIADIEELTPTPRPPPPPTPQPPTDQFTRYPNTLAPKGVSKSGLGQVQSLQRQGTNPPEPEPEPEPEPSPFEPPPRERGSTSQQAGPQLRSKIFPTSTTKSPYNPSKKPDPYTALELGQYHPFKQGYEQYREGNILEGTFDQAIEVQDKIGNLVEEDRLRQFAKQNWRKTDLHPKNNNPEQPEWDNLTERKRDVYARKMYDSLTEDPDFAQLVNRAGMFGMEGFREDLLNVDFSLGEDGYGSDIDDEGARDRDYDGREDALERLEYDRDVIQKYEDGELNLTPDEHFEAFKQMLGDGVFGEVSLDDDDDYVVELDVERYRHNYSAPFAITGYYGDGYPVPEYLEAGGGSEESDDESEPSRQSSVASSQSSDASRQSSVASSVEPEPELEFRTITLGGREYQLNVRENTLISEEEFEPIDGNFSLVDGKLFKTDNNGRNGRMVTSIFGDTAFVNETPVQQFVPKSQRVPKGSHRMPDGSIMKNSAMEPEPEPEPEPQRLLFAPRPILGLQQAPRAPRPEPEPEPQRLLFAPRPEPEPEPQRPDLSSIESKGQVEDVTDEIADGFLTEVEGAFSGGKLFKKIGNKKKDYALDPDQNHYLIEMDGKKYVVVEHNPRTGNILLQIADTVNRGNAEGKNRKNVKKDKLLKLIQDGDVPLQKISSNYKG